MLNLLNIFAAIASVIGLGLSIFAVIRADAAKRAAIEAKRAARQSSAVEEQRRLATVANEMLLEIHSSQWRTARMRCADLIMAVTFAKHRWQSFSTPEISQSLENALGGLNKLSRAISSDAVELPDPVRTKILTACHDIVVQLAEAAGRMQQALEVKDNG